MQLTPEQLSILRNATKDDHAFEQVLDVFNQASTPSVNNLFNLNAEQTQSIQSLIDVLPIALYIKDVDSRFLTASKITQNHLKIKHTRDLVGKTDFDFMDAEIAQYHYDMEQTIIKTQTPIFDFESCTTDSNGKTTCHRISKSPIYDRNGEVIGLVGINQDITDEEIAQQELQDERNLLQTVINTIEDKIYIKDRQSRFIMANTSTLIQQDNMSLDELIGRSDFDFMPYNRARVMFDEEQQVMETGIPILNQELLTPDSLTNCGDKWFLVSKVPSIDENGVVTGLVGVNRNITSRIQARQHQIEIAVEREKSQFFQKFVTDTSHEFSRRCRLSAHQVIYFLK